jgi:16S rRNA (adenine1518-N6/adenine1519-N6)-dimethyltransferase
LSEAAPGSQRPWSALRARLEAQGFRPSRALGQNFLLDSNLARAIARDARVSAGDFVVEVGPGCGALSRELAALGVQLVAFEIDRRLTEIAREELAPFTNAEVVRADVLAGKHELAPEVRERLPSSGPWHVVANLPYSAGTPFLALVARLECPPLSMTVLLQRELAERLAAQPGSKTWGPVGAKIALVYGVELVRRVGTELFWPKPKVESAVARFELRPNRPAAADIQVYDRLVEALFQARRKTLLSRLADWTGDRDAARARLAALGLDPSARPETLGVAELLALARSLGPP